ncbi:MAG: tagaturonate reductase [Chitinophagaceae bacterium]
MKLSQAIINTLNPDHAEIPSAEYFNLPEKVVQFGTGVLLRALPDYYIDKANKQGIFNGRVVVVKSTVGDSVDTFNKQDCLFTHCIRGIEDGRKIEENSINASITRVLSATDDWDSVLHCAADPNIQVVISNTTEVGITRVKDNIHASPPVSFPGKLTAFLFKRYKHFKGDESKGMVIIPTELIPANGTTLKAIVLELALQNDLEPAFINWIVNANTFCNSLVDRIVPGKLPPEEQIEVEQKGGYKDELMIMSEPYGLWAIEPNSERVKETLSFHLADEGVIITPDIHIFRELKLRLLNGSHTFSCGLAHLAGFKTVKQAMDNEVFEAYISRLMMLEIVPSITSDELSSEQAVSFAKRVLDRYRNPFIRHQWLSITLQYTSKMVMRNICLIRKYFERHGSVPGYMALGLAGHLLFMKCEKSADGKYYGKHNGESYPVNDDHAAYFSEKWRGCTIDQLVETVFCDKDLWGENLTEFPGLVDAVTVKLNKLMKAGSGQFIHQLIDEK